MGKDSETKSDLRVVADGWREKYEFVRDANLDLNAAIEKKNREIKKLRKQLQNLDWQPITADNLPKVGDEVLRITTMGSPRVYTVERDCDSIETAHALMDTHRRPINPPKCGSRGICSHDELKWGRNKEWLGGKEIVVCGRCREEMPAELTEPRSS